MLIVLHIFVNIIICISNTELHKMKVLKSEFFSGFSIESWYAVVAG